MTLIDKKNYQLYPEENGSFCSASLDIPITNGLTNVYSKIKANEYPHEIISIVSKINTGLKDLLSNVEYNDILGITTFFDLRFKTFAFYDPTCAERIKEIVISSVSLKYNSELEHQIQEDTIIEETPRKNFQYGTILIRIFLTLS